jgi:uncharacterized protein (DUF1684 family)
MLRLLLGPVLVTAPLALLAACSRAPSPSDPAFAAEWKAWHDRREERLRTPDGWLALTGLHWLAPGENRIPGLPGAFVLEGGRVALAASASDGYTLEGAPVERRTLATDAVEKPDRLKLPPGKTLQIIDRAGRLAVRIWDAESPVLKKFRGIETYPPDPRWRIEARWEAYQTPRPVEVPSVTGEPQKAVAPGKAHFEVGGRAVSLEPTAEGDELFFVFKDATAPKETYGAGRFLYAAAPKDGKVILDFNRAYNPPCVFTPYATCPLPTPENVLPLRIEAGEKKWGDH